MIPYSYDIVLSFIYKLRPGEGTTVVAPITKSFKNKTSSTYSIEYKNNPLGAELTPTNFLSGQRLKK